MPNHPALPIVLPLVALLAAAGCAQTPVAATATGPLPRAATAAPLPATPKLAPLCPAATALENRTRSVAAKCVATTVGLIDAKGLGVSSGSGVVVSADGLILTAGHVVDKPGTAIGIRFADGRVAKGVALGVDRGADSGMARITDAPPAGGWPFSPMAKDASASPGEWVLATGNPGGIVLDRNPPLRLGRVAVHDGARIQSDCTVVSGDSGGPLFNLAGEVVGIHSNISLNIHENRHVPISVYRAQWADLLAGKDIRGTAGMLAPPQGKEEDEDGDTPAPKPGAKPNVRPDSSPESRLEASRMARRLGETSLPALALFVPALEAAGDCAVEIRAYGKPILMGTIVSTDGLIATKASDLKTSAPQVILPDGRAMIAKIIGQDTATDLALLKVEAGGLTAAAFADDAELGAWLVSPQRNPNQPAVGLVSIGARPIPKAFNHFYGEQKIMLGLAPARRRACVVGQVLPGLPAAKAGFLPNDEILALNGKPVADWAGFQAGIKDAKPGDVLTIEVRRRGKTLELKPLLGAFKTAAATAEGIGEADALAGGRLSGRRTDFPQAIQHDAVVWADQCGGPLLNLQGKTIGINIARYDRVCTFALPAALVQKTVARLRAPKPQAAPGAPAASVAPASGIKLPELPDPK